jgi:hypothetical protein
MQPRTGCCGAIGNATARLDFIAAAALAEGRADTGALFEERPTNRTLVWLYSRRRLQRRRAAVDLG